MKVKWNGTETDDISSYLLNVDIVYSVICIESGDYRLRTDVADFPSSYPNSMFDLVERAVPLGWVFAIDSHDETDRWYFGPPEFFEIGYWEDLHDRHEAAIAVWEQYLLNI